MGRMGMISAEGTMVVVISRLKAEVMTVNDWDDLRCVLHG